MKRSAMPRWHGAGQHEIGGRRALDRAGCPAREGHATRDRIAHLVDRMLTAKMHGAEAIFVSDPFDPDRGLVDRNGSPSELFLPWRTTALMLGGAPYVGDIDLPQGNQIHCFGGKGKYVGVLAGRKPGQETVYLGTELRTLRPLGQQPGLSADAFQRRWADGSLARPAVGDRRAATADFPRRARWPHHRSGSLAWPFRPIGCRAFPAPSCRLRWN